MALIELGLVLLLQVGPLLLEALTDLRRLLAFRSRLQRLVGVGVEIVGQTLQAAFGRGQLLAQRALLGADAIECRFSDCAPGWASMPSI